MMSFKEFKTVCKANVAGPQVELNTKNSTVLPLTTSTPSPSPSTSSATQDEVQVKMCKMFAFIDDTYRGLRRFNSGLHKNSVSSQLIQTLNKYKSGCNNLYTKALESYDICYKLAQNIVQTTDIFKELCTCLTDLEEYNYRLCEIMSIFIVCELRLSIEAPQQEQLLIARRIIYIMRKVLVQEEQNETLYNILRTLVYIPKFFNARDIMCAIFGEFIPIKPVPKVNTLPDKIYILYIIVFYRWMMMQKDDDNKQLIVNFAESFMKPSVTLCSNTLYAAYLPMYTTHSTATRTILNNLKFYRDIRNASIIDNAFKNIGNIVNLCDDEEDDVILVDNASTTDFAQIFASVCLEPLSGNMSNIKLEEKTVVGNIDLTVEEEEEEGKTANPVAFIFERHNKWLNEFHRAAKEYREAQLFLEKQQNNQLRLNGEERTIICLDSDSEEELEEGISAAASKETAAAPAATAAAKSATPVQQNTTEDLFVDSYPLTNTPINCDSDLESLETEDENDVTKISSRFLTGTLRTYHAKKSYLTEAEDKNNSDANENNKSQDMNKAYRRDSIHISSSPPEGSQIEDDEGTDVQDEHDDDLIEDEDEVNNAYNFLPTSVKRAEKKLFPKEIRPMGPYPTYNSMQNDKVVYSQILTRNPKQQQYQDKQQHYYSDSSEKTPKKQKKRVQFNTNPLGPTSSSAPQKTPLKPALQQPKYKVSDDLEYFHLRGFERFSCAPSIAGSTSTLASNSTTSSIKQQEPTNEKCINQPTCNEKNLNHINKCSNLYKNLSVFKQKFSNMNFKQQKSLRNVKINLKKLRLGNDISLTNLKTSFISNKKPHTTTLYTLINKNNLNNNIKKTTPCKQTESCQIIRTNPISATATVTNENKDDVIFKKPLPVTKKIFKSPKPLKIKEVVSLRTHPYYFNRKQMNNKMNNTDGTKIIKSPVNKQISDIETKTNSEFLTNDCDYTDMDDLSKISKLLTEQINNLTSETIKKDKIKQTQIDKQNQNILQNDLDIQTGGNKESKEKQDERDEQVQEQEHEREQEPEPEQERAIVVTNSAKNAEEISHSFENVETIEKHSENLENSIKSSDKKENLSNFNEETKSLLIAKEKLTISDSLRDNEKRNELMVDEGKHNFLLHKDQTENDIETEEAKILDLNQNSQTNIEIFLSDSIPTHFALLEKENNIKLNIAENIQDSNNKPVTNFSAEFLAGLPNEPSPSHNDNSESEFKTKNDIDFEFENNCSTPTMCRIDLDEMSENTSDVPPAMLNTILPIEECEADKLLEDFNHKTEDIVGSALNKKPLTSEATVSCTKNNDDLPKNGKEPNKESLHVDNAKEAPKRLLEETVLDVDEEDLINKSMKKSLNDECLTAAAGPNEQASKILKESKSQMSSNEAVTTTTEINQNEDIALDCDRKKDSVKSKKQSKMAADSKKNRKIPKIKFSNQEETNESLSSRKSNKKSKSFQRYPTSPLKELPKDANKSPGAENSCEIKENKEKSSSEEIEQTAKEEIRPQQMEASISENQHMTVELGNWKQEVQDENKTNDSETGGVSAIFSFPKIPIISISILTSPNNKTYFKISNRENEGEKTKKAKSAEPDGEEEIKNDETVVKENMETNDEETKEANKEKLIKYPVVEDNEYGEKEDIEKEEEEEEEGETDFEIEKFSHDSNSACSLPLKKRPTQSEPNGDTEDSQLVVSSSYEQPQEIAAEVVVENTCKDKTLMDGNSITLELEQDHEHNNQETATQEQEQEDVMQDIFSTDETLNLQSDLDESKPSTSLACFRKLSDPSSPFKRRVHVPTRPTGQTPIQIVAPQLKENCLSPSQDHRAAEAQVPSAPRLAAQSIQPLPESYPATPMLSVANVEKLMDFNRFIEDLLASPDVMTIIDNANACGYYAEGQTYEMERIAILEHYNIANAKGNTSATKPLYWKKSAGDTISIFNDNDNEWISLPPSTAKQLQKLSFVLSILQQQYKVNDVRQRINIALTFLIRNTSKFKNNSSPSTALPQRIQSYNRNIPDINSASQSLPPTSYFRGATENESLNSNLNIEAVQDLLLNDYANNQQQVEMTLQHEPTTNNNQSWNNNLKQLASTGTAPQASEQIISTNSPQSSSSYNIECEQQQQQISTQEKRKSSCDESNNDQLYINPPCATSPQNEVIVNTNGVELHEMPQDQQNIFISITDESNTTNLNAESPLHKYNTRQQHQQQLQQFRTLGEIEGSSPSVSLAQQSYGKRACLGNNGPSSLLPSHLVRNTFINTFGNQEIILQNPYRMQQQQQHQQQQQQQGINQNSNTNSNFNFQHQQQKQHNISPQNSPINVYSDNRHSSPLVQTQQHTQQRMPARFSSPFNNQLTNNNAAPTPAKSNESNYKEILQPYITYLIKDHEKTSKHLLQVFEEVSNSNLLNAPTANNNLNPAMSHVQHPFNNLLPPLIKNPQQNHMPGLYEMPTGGNSGVLPSLIRNPQHNTLVHRDSGALQVVQSFLEQSQTGFVDTQQQQQQQQQQSICKSKQSTSPLIHPGFAKEYVNFIGSRDEIEQKLQSKTVDREQQQQQLNNQLLLQQQDSQRLNSLKRKCQERNDKLSEVLKRKMIEFSLLKHNVHIKLLERKQSEQQQQNELNQIENCIVTTTNKRRGRPKKTNNKMSLDKNNEANSVSNSDLFPAKEKCIRRLTRRNQSNSDFQNVSTTTDHAYFKQRSAAREAAKRINASVNNNYQ